MATSAIPDIPATNGPTKKAGRTRRSKSRWCTAGQLITFTSDLPDTVPVMPAEFDLMRIYFADLIGALSEDDQ